MEEDQDRKGWLDPVLKANLVLTTLAQVWLTRAMVRPQLVTFLFGLSASEFAHILVFWQAANLYGVNAMNPDLFAGEGNWLSKFLLLVNALCFSKQLPSVKDLLGSKQDFEIALARGGIKSYQSKWAYFLLTFLPIPYLNRRGKQLTTKSFRYANIRQVDPDLCERWANTSATTKRLFYVRSGRDVVPNWMSLDVVARHDLVPGAPVLMYIHGGGWTVGSKRFALKSTLERIASRGVIVVSINYRLSPEVAFPEHALDCKRALVFVKQHCAEWGGNKDLVFVSGESAGGHLSALMGTTPNLAELQPFAPNEDTSIAGCIPLYGVLDMLDGEGHLATLHPPPLAGLEGFGPQTLLERVVFQQPLTPETQHVYELASPPFHVKRRSGVEADLPPFMVVHGTRDALAAYDDSRAFYQALLDYRYRVQSKHGDVFVPLPHSWGSEAR
ncbi:hypothetical protein BASA82_001166 [Batrachochytrium salamandrivorans]|nr:hypothetical protein BASA81_004924 [Batrachochytrium salamandrivorans]KAH9260165.1 hypothetical protein BASA82_001166 [Batrachochytrium salamandrivorans]